LETVLLAANYSAFSAVTNRLLFLLSSMEIWWWEYRMSYSLSQMKKRIETSLVFVKKMCLCKSVGKKLFYMCELNSL